MQLLNAAASLLQGLQLARQQRRQRGDEGGGAAGRGAAQRGRCGGRGSAQRALSLAHMLRIALAEPACPAAQPLPLLTLTMQSAASCPIGGMRDSLAHRPCTALCSHAAPPLL